MRGTVGEAHAAFAELCVVQAAHTHTVVAGEVVGPAGVLVATGETGTELELELELGRSAKQMAHSTRCGALCVVHAGHVHVSCTGADVRGGG